MVTALTAADFKLTMRVKDEKLAKGRYILTVVPIWNETANLAPSFKNVTIGIYAPLAIKLTRGGRGTSKSSKVLGYRALSFVFSNIQA